MRPRVPSDHPRPDARSLDPDKPHIIPRLPSPSLLSAITLHYNTWRDPNLFVCSRLWLAAGLLTHALWPLIGSGYFPRFLSVGLCPRCQVARAAQAGQDSQASESLELVLIFQAANNTKVVRIQINPLHSFYSQNSLSFFWDANFYFYILLLLSHKFFSCGANFYF